MKEAGGTATKPTSLQGEICIKMPPDGRPRQSDKVIKYDLAGGSHVLSDSVAVNGWDVPGVDFDQPGGMVFQLRAIQVFKTGELVHLCVPNPLRGSKTALGLTFGRSVCWLIIVNFSESEQPFPLGCVAQTHLVDWMLTKCSSVTCHMRQFCKLIHRGKMGYSDVPYSEICLLLPLGRFILSVLLGFLLFLNNNFWILNLCLVPI